MTATEEPRPRIAEIVLAHPASAEELETLRTLLREYAAHLNATTPGGKHVCLESYEKELASLPGAYAQPEGTLLLAYLDGEPAGCVAVKRLNPQPPPETGEVACELKRLWVRPRFRGHGLGVRLVKAALRDAVAQGYTAAYLDTVPVQMESATQIYRKLGFEPAKRYRATDLLSYLGDQAPEIVFFRRSLADPLP